MIEFSIESLLRLMGRRVAGKVPSHIAVIPNGHRRLSTILGILLKDSYLLGARRALEFAGWAKGAGVTHVTFFGLSCENMKKRTDREIDALMEGAIWFCDRAMELGYALHPFGNIDEFEGVEKYAPLYERLKKLREDYRPSEEFTIHVAVNYSGLAEHELGHLIDKVYCVGYPEVRKDPMRYLLSGGVPMVDLLVRTGGEARTSGLLPFQVAYAELRFVKKFWARFTRRDFMRALAWYAKQPRNFGK